MKRLIPVLTLVLVASACGDDSSLLEGGSSSSTSVATEAPTTTTTAAPTTTASTTTTKAPKPFRFEPDGLGVVHFGQTPRNVIAEMTAIFGPPTADSG